MPTYKEQFETAMNELANSINEKAGTTGKKTIAQMKTAVDSIVAPTGTINISNNGMVDVTNYSTANVNVQPNLQSKTVTPTTSQQIIEPDSNKDGLSSVTINAVTSSIDSNIVAENIKKDITILGVTGTLDNSGGELNIAYGLNPPQDTSKLWVKRATEPDKVILKNWFNGDVDGVGIADIGTLPLQLEAAACAVIGGKCYIFGGKASNSVQTKIYKYDTENNILTELTVTLPAGRQGMACGIVGTNIYLFGGSASIYNGYTNTIYKFDTLTETITTLTTVLPIKLGEFNCAVVGVNCYLIGGYTDSYTPSYTSNTIYKFDTTTETITSYKALPARLYNAACGVVGTNIYIFGGYNGGSSAYSDKIYKVDTATNILTTLSATLPEAKQEMSVGVVGTNIYLFGGTTSSNAFGTSEIYKFDTETNAISILSTTLLHSIKGTAYGVVGTNVYLFAGMYVGYIQKFTVSVELAENNLFITYNANLEADTKIINWETAEFFISINAMLIGNSNDLAEAVHWATHDGTNWINDDGTVEFTKLYPPTISISGATLTIVNDSRNSSYVTAYKIYNGQTLLTTTANTTVDLSSIISTAGTYNLTVVASGTGYTDSNASNEVELSAYSITNVLTNVSAAAGNATVMLNTQSSVALTYTANSGYTLPQGSTSAELNVVGCDFTWNQASGVLTLSNPTGNITVTIVGEVVASGYSVEVTASGLGDVEVYDGEWNSSPTYLNKVTNGNTETFNISSGYMTLMSAGAYGDYFDSSPTCTGGVSEISTSGDICILSVVGSGTVEAYPWCIIEGTQITLADGSTKAIEDITYDDELLVWDFYKGKLSTAKPKWIMQESKANKYNLVKFSNGTSVGFVGAGGKKGYHRIFNQQAGAFTHTGVEETPIGTLTYDQHGYFPEVVSQEIIKGEVRYYNIITDKHFNLFANGILTSCRLSNKYKIENMKYVGEELISAKDEEKYFKKIETRKK